MSQVVPAAVALRECLNWIDGVPADTPLPAMPGFDRDWVESLIAGQMDGWPALTFESAVDMAQDWIDAVPADVRAALPPFIRPALPCAPGRPACPTGAA